MHLLMSSISKYHYHGETTLTTTTTITPMRAGPGDQSWRVPDGVSVSALPTCNMDAEVFVLRDAAELQATLGGWAELRAGLGLGLIFHVRFSGHAEVRDVAG